MTLKMAKHVGSTLLGRLRPGNVVMFHIGRCGSSVVGQLLRQHSRIYWANEPYARIFEGWQKASAGIETVGKMPEDAVSYLRKDMRRALHRFYGCEIKPFHFRLIGYSPESFLQHLDALGFRHFILLDRKNRLRKIISILIAFQSGRRYHNSARTEARLNRVRIDVNDVRTDFDAKPLVDYLADYDRQMAALAALLEGRRVLRLTYESDIQADPRRAYALICEFLGLRPQDVTVTLARTNPFPVKDMLENFDEVRAALAGTPYEWMLDE